jgi:hypothetical protein
MGMDYRDMEENPESLDIVRKPPSPKQVIGKLKSLVPKFSSMPLSDRIKFALTDMILLFCFAVAFFMAAFFSFIKAEIIE